MSNGDAERPSTRVVAKVADAEGVGQSDLAVKLSEVVDPDALDSLFAPTRDGARRQEGTVEFVYLGYDVTVEADGSVAVEPSG